MEALLEAGHYVEAVAQARERLGAAERDAGPGALRTARALDGLVEALLRSGQAASAETGEMAERALRLREGRVAEADPQRVAALRRLGRVRADAGRVQDALPLFERALALARTFPAGERGALAGALEDWASALLTAGRGDEAEQALAEVERLGPGAPDDALGRARRLELRARLHRLRGRYDPMRAAIDAALELRRRAQAPDHPDLARATRLRADADWFQARYEDARAGFDRALELAQRSLGPRHPFVATCLEDVALLAEEYGELERALELRRRALEATVASRPRAHPDYVLRLHGLGDTHLLLGRHAAARGFYERALAALESLADDRPLEAAALRHNLALVHARLGDFEEATRLNDAALATWERLGGQHAYVARALEALGSVLQEEGRDAQARGLLERCVAIRAARLGADHPDLLRARTMLATSLDRLGATREALTQLDLAAASWSRAGRPRRLAFADPLQRRAWVLARQGRWRDARRDFESARRLLEPALGADHPAAADARAGLAACALGRRRWSRAQRLALDADAARRGHVDETLRHLAERQALLFAARPPVGRDLALSVAASGRAQPDEIARTFDAVVRGRARVLEELAARARTAADPHEARDAGLREALQAARRDYARALARTLDAGLDAAHAARLLAARRRQEGLEVELQATDVRPHDERPVHPADRHALGAALPADSALVAYVRYVETRRAPGGGLADRPAYLAFVLKAGERIPRVIPLGSAEEVEARVAAWRRRVSDWRAAETTPARAEREVRDAASALAGAIWSPLDRARGPATRVFVVPDAALHLVSFPALVGASGRYLVEGGPLFHVLTAERDLLGSAPEPAGRGLLALGDPDFDALPGGTLVAGSAPQSEPGRDVLLRGSRATCAPGTPAPRFARLDEARAEVSAVAGLWAATSRAWGPARLLVGAQATEARFRETAKGKRALHLATHGFFSSGACAPGDVGFEAGALALSGLALAGANHRGRAAPDDDDGLLTAEEVATLDLRGVEWAVLSACDTGVGNVPAGEGVLGLQRAFRLAGVRTVIMSLWPVDERATRRLMSGLYEAHLRGGLGAAKALQAARLELLCERRARGLGEHPFFWAAFVATGDWR